MSDEHHTIRHNTNEFHHLLSVVTNPLKFFSFMDFAWRCLLGSDDFLLVCCFCTKAIALFCWRSEASRICDSRAALA
jgi:hypothetical protein